MLRLAAALLVAVAAAAVPAGAHPEADAAALDPRVAAAWHEPADVRPGEQWHGFLRLREDATPPANVSYQVCNVADGVCFSFPHPAQALGNGTYRFDTRDYRTNLGEPVRWEAGWGVGVRWFLADAAGNGTWVPPQDGPTIESHYLTFAIAGTPQRGAPGVGLLAAATTLALAGAAARRRA